MKSFIIQADVGAAIAAKEWLKVDGAGGVIPSAAAADGSLGLAESFGDTTTYTKVGVVKKALMKVTAAAATYKFGDNLELDSTGQVATAETSNPVVCTAAESLVLSAPGDLLVYVNL